LCNSYKIVSKELDKADVKFNDSTIKTEKSEYIVSEELFSIEEENSSNPFYECQAEIKLKNLLESTILTAEISSILKLPITVSNKSKNIWPKETTIDIISTSILCKSIMIGSIKPGESNEFEIELKIPNLPGIYEVNLKLKDPTGNKIEGGMLNFKINAKSEDKPKAKKEKVNLKFPDIENEINRFRTYEKLIRLHVSNDYLENMRKLIELFKKKDPKQIYEKLIATKNDFNKAVSEVYQLPSILDSKLISNK